MTRVTSAALAALAALAAVLGACAGDGDHDGSRDVPTFVVSRAHFTRQVGADGYLRAVKATEIQAPQVSEDSGGMKIAWLAPDGTAVKAGDIVVRFDRGEREKALRDGKADLDSASSRLREENIKSAAAVDGRDVDADLAVAELAQQEHFQAKDPELYSKKDIIESQVDEHLASAKKDHAEQAKAIERQLSQTKAGLIAVEEAKAKLAIDHASKDLDSMVVRAPHDGIFVLEPGQSGPHKIGDQLWPGERFAELPLLDAMEVELYVLEVDGSGLAEGQPAEIVVQAHPDHTYTGKVRLVDKLAKERQTGVPVRYFQVIVALDKTDRDVMKPGQRVQGTLVLDQEDALVVPREAIVDAAGKTFAYRRGEHGFERVAVELGAASSGRVVVKSGIAAGDEVALRDPTRAADDEAGSGSAAKGAK